MKKALLILTICALAFSCDKSHKVTLASFGNIESSSSIMSDWGILQNIKQSTAIKSEDVGKRVYYVFGMDIRDTTQIELYGITAVRVKEYIPTSTITEETDTLGNNIVFVNSFAQYEGGYLNIEFGFSAVPYLDCMEIINLEYDDVTNHGDSLIFTLHHKRYMKDSNDTSDQKYEAGVELYSGLMCFPINKIMETKIEQGLEKVPIKIYGVSRYGRKVSVEGTVKTETFIQKPLQNK